MKVKVIKKYSDKYTGELKTAGQTIETTPERAKELIDAGVCKEIKKGAEKAK